MPEQNAHYDRLFYIPTLSLTFFGPVVKCAQARLLESLVWFHGGRLGGARLPPASSGLRVPNFERRRAGGGEKNTPPACRAVTMKAGGVPAIHSSTIENDDDEEATPSTFNPTKTAT